jgi:hypothetical protein
VAKHFYYLKLDNNKNTAPKIAQKDINSLFDTHMTVFNPLNLDAVKNRTTPTLDPIAQNTTITPASTSGFSPSVQSIIQSQSSRFGVDAQALGQLIAIESNGNINAVSPSGNHFGLMQLSNDIAGGINVFDPAQNITAGLNNMRDNLAPALSKAIGVPVNQLTATDFYLAHQQGQTGGPALSKAARDPNDERPAWQVVRDEVNRLYPDPGMSDEQAKDHIYGNTPPEFQGDKNTMTAATFMGLWRKRIGEPAASEPFFTAPTLTASVDQRYP